MARLLSTLTVVVCLFAATIAAQAQTPQTGRLLITVADQTGGVIPTARVTVLPQAEAW